jgi:hypothetical protein
MNVAFGLRAHSGWAALVALGSNRGQLQVVDRCRLELVEEANSDWARQPYHAAEELGADAARAMVKEAIDSARRLAVRELRSAVRRVTAAGHGVIACAVLVGDGMPDWTAEQVLAVHFRMHKAEGELFRDVLVRAAHACALRLVAVRERELPAHAERALRKPAAALQQELATLGKTAGPPWAKDQKDATLAAMIALHGTPSPSRK